MKRKTRRNQNIINFILQQVELHPANIAALTAAQFGITRVTVNRYLNQLKQDNLIIFKGKHTSSRKYYLNNFINKEFHFETIRNNEEHKIWQTVLSPYFSDLKKNILDICYFGITEMINNVIDHSNSKTFIVNLKRNAIKISIEIIDQGIGIFEKIRQVFNLDDPRHALLELSKGKLTTDSKNHSGQGIFFTSRMFDYTAIYSGELYYSRRIQDHDDWLIKVNNHSQKIIGTYVLLEIGLDVERTTKEVFDQYTDDEYRFSRTHVPVRLAKYGAEELVSRSQAKRVLARFDKFSEIILDFQDVQQIGQAFADQIFRVFKNEHPEINIIPLNTTPEIDKMIQYTKMNS